MREIKFRAWHRKRKKYYEVLHLHIENEKWATCKGFDIISQQSIHIQIQPNDIILEQYTGLKDKNGKEIYEGDIVKGFIWLQTSQDPEALSRIDIKGCISFIDGFFYIKNKNGSNLCPFYFPDYEIEIIGNIHENPELLKCEQ